MIQKYKHYQFLFEELVKRDFTKKYKRTFFGMAWSIISPLVNLFIMWLVFGNLLGSNVNHYVIYLFSGQLVFSYFSEATSMGMSSLVSNAPIFSKINVPKYLFLFSQNVSSLINFGLTLLVYLFFVVIEGIQFTWSFFMLIYPILCLIIFNLGVGLVLSAAFMFFRDMQYLWGIISQLIMWLSAIFYPVENFPDNVQRLFLINPLYLIIKYFRTIVIEGNIPSVNFHLLMLVDVVLVFVVGIWIYRKYNTEFLYYV